jgi:hypothetical protein
VTFQHLVFNWGEVGLLSKLGTLRACLLLLEVQYVPVREILSKKNLSKDPMLEENMPRGLFRGGLCEENSSLSPPASRRTNDKSIIFGSLLLELLLHDSIGRTMLSLSQPPLRFVSTCKSLGSFQPIKLLKHAY